MKTNGRRRLHGHAVIFRGINPTVKPALSIFDDFMAAHELEYDAIWPHVFRYMLKSCDGNMNVMNGFMHAGIMPRRPARTRMTLSERGFMHYPVGAISVGCVHEPNACRKSSERKTPSDGL